MSGQQWRQTAKCLVVRLLPRSGYQAFQTCEAWAHNLLTVQLVTGELEEQRRFVMLQGTLKQPSL